MPGKVTIVGAGPGPADLLTQRACAALRAADVVLHDDLVTADVLAQAPPSARTLNVGKRCGTRTTTQDQINALMIWHARRGKLVVRLKSGDPAVFGRLGEELDALRRAGVAYEIIPGITASSAAAASVGITLTDRHSASALMVVTAHNVRGEKLRANGFDPRRTSFAVYMPGPDYGRTARDLMESGVDCNTPCVLVSHAGRASEQKCFMQILDLPFALGVAAPAILIVGEVARRIPDHANKDLRDLLPNVLSTLKPEGDKIQRAKFIT